MSKKTSFSKFSTPSPMATNPRPVELPEKPTPSNENEIALAFAALKEEVRDLRRRVEFLERENRAIRAELGDLGNTLE